MGILPQINTFSGDKIKVSRILNVEITVFEYKIEPSKQKENSNYMTLQIEKNGIKHIVFTGSKVLMQQIKQVSKEQFPFSTTIVGEKEYYEFT
jgi:hypothetical protein